MAKEYDAYQTTIASLKTWNAKTWPTAFAAAPQVFVDSPEDDKQAGCKSITTTGADISCQTLDVNIMLATQGYSAAVIGAHPERDADGETIATGKSYQAFVFNSAFAAAPEVICGYESAFGGKEYSVKSITTTGGDIVGDDTGSVVHWLAHNS